LLSQLSFFFHLGYGVATEEEEKEVCRQSPLFKRRKKGETTYPIETKIDD